MSAEAGKPLRSIALVSGGLDSLVSLASAMKARRVESVMFFDYGQRARESERVSSMSAANYYGLPFEDVDVRWLEALAPPGMQSSARAGDTGRGTSAQAKRSGPGADGDRTREGASDDEDHGLTTLDEVWIPNRNGVFLNVAAAYAERYRCDTIVTGFNHEEAQEFPDNSGEYVARVNRALEMSTRNHVRVESFTLDLDKPAILRLGLAIKAPLSIIWSCYRSGERMCGRCASCVRLRAALESLPAADRPRIEFDA